MDAASKVERIENENLSKKDHDQLMIEALNEKGQELASANEKLTFANIALIDENQKLKKELSELRSKLDREENFNEFGYDGRNH